MAPHDIFASFDLTWLIFKCATEKR